MDNCSLGKDTIYSAQYDHTLLFKISREQKRSELKLSSPLPFYGIDIWNAYEVSWLNIYGKPLVAIAEIIIDANSEFLLESKSFKLYLNSFNDTKFQTKEKVSNLIQQDLSQLLQSDVKVVLFDLSEYNNNIARPSGYNIDNLNITCSEFNTANPKLLEYDDQIVEEELTSHLLKSNCLITNQPDWASVAIKYHGKKLVRSSLLQYIVSFRNHNEFHEQCVERIFNDIHKLIKPDFLSVYARYTRRGGIDICPYRTTTQMFSYPSNDRFVRQ